MSEKRLPASHYVFGLLVVALFMAACTGGRNGEVTCARDGAVLEDGLVITDVRCGSGAPAERGMTASVRYEAELADGGSISTTEAGEADDDTYTFRLGSGQVVPAWDIGLVGMSEGGVRRIDSPPDLAYGQAGLFPDVPPGAAVTFEVELLELSEPPEE